MKEEDYPYTGRDHTACKFDKSKIAASVSNFSVVSSDEDQIAANLVKHGPLAIAINVVWIQTYIGGVSCPYVCSKSQDHGVLLVGFGSSGYAPIRLKEKPYWIIKNSWERCGESMVTTKSAEDLIICGLWTLWYLLLLLFIPHPSRIIRTLHVLVYMYMYVWLHKHTMNCYC